MKIQLSLLLIVVLAACNTASEKQKTEIAQSEFNEQVELAAIMKVIQRETDCFTTVTTNAGLHNGVMSHM